MPDNYLTVNSVCTESAVTAFGVVVPLVSCVGYWKEINGGMDFRKILASFRVFSTKQYMPVKCIHLCTLSESRIISFFRHRLLSLINSLVVAVRKQLWFVLVSKQFFTTKCHFEGQ